MNNTVKRILFYVIGAGTIIAAYVMVSLKVESDQNKKQQQMDESIKTMQRMRGY